MEPHPCAAPGAAPDDPRVEALERAWREGGSPPELRTFLDAAVLGDGRRLLALVEVDCRHRLARGHPAGIAHYLDVVPDLTRQREVCQHLLLVELLRTRPADLEAWTAAILARTPSLDEDLALVRDLHGTLSGAPSTSRLAGGRYELLARLGEGLSGVVYRAFDHELERSVAIKVLSGIADPERFRRFRREAVLASRLDHPLICKVLTIGSEDHTPYIVMPFVAGETLAARLAREAEAAPRAAPRSSSGEPVRIREAVRLVEKLARALHVAHESGVVHRDLNPRNVMITPPGDPVLLDFGLSADLIAGPSSMSRDAKIIGTPAYLAPELLDFESGARAAVAGAQSDLYALGVILYEMLALARPYDAPHLVGLIAQVRTQEPRDLRRLNSYVSRDLGAVVATAIERDRRRRYGSAALFAEDLARFLAGEPVLARRAGPARRAGKWIRRNRVVSASGFLVVAVLSAALGIVSSERAVAEGARVVADHARQDADRERTAARRAEAAARAEAEKSKRSQAAEAGRRGLWRVQVGLLDELAAASAQVDSSLHLERARTLLAMNRFDEVERDLAALDERAALATDQQRATVKLLRGEMALTDPSTWARGHVLVSEALATGALDPTDAHYARGLIEESTPAAQRWFEEALALTPGHRGARVGLLVSSLLLGRLDRVDQLAAIHAALLPDDPFPSVATLWARIAARDRDAIRTHLEPLRARLGDEAVLAMGRVADATIDLLELVDESFDRRGFDLPALPAFLRLLEMKAAIDDGALDNLGFRVPAVYRMKLLWTNLQAVALLLLWSSRSEERYLELAERHPDGFFLYCAVVSGLQRVTALEKRAGEKAIHEPLVILADRAMQAAATPSLFQPPPMRQALALIVNGMLRRFPIEEQPADLDLRLRKLVALWMGDAGVPLEVVSQSCRMIVGGVAIDLEIGRILFGLWQRAVPTDPEPLRLRAAFELDGEQHEAALDFATAALALDPANPDLIRIAAAARESLAAKLAPGPPPSKPGDDDPPPDRGR